MPASKATKTSVRKNPSPARKTADPDSLVNPRRLQLSSHIPFWSRMSGNVKHSVAIPSVWQLSKKTAQVLWQHRRLFIGIALVYGILNILLVRGLTSGTDVSSLKQQLSQAAHGQAGQVTIGLSVFSNLLTSSNDSANAASGAYQIFLGLIVSLAAIWALRQVIAGEQRVRLRDAFYKGMYPLIPFVLVLIVVILQTLPFLAGAALYSLVVSNGIAVYWDEKLLWGLLFLVLAIISAYMLCSSLFAAYIVTLPDMTPMKALRSARQLVQYRRPAVFRKLLFLPLALLVIAVIIMMPFIIFIAALAPWIFFILTICVLIIIHAYMYTLYRELLQ